MSVTETRNPIHEFHTSFQLSLSQLDMPIITKRLPFWLWTTRSEFVYHWRNEHQEMFWCTNLHQRII